MSLNLIGEFFGTSGYASHTRYLANELNKLIDCKLVTSLPQGFERDVNDKELEMIKREQDFDINLIITHPLYWRINCSAKRNFVYLIWEGDKIPYWMGDECLNSNIEKIIVPSQHTYDAAKSSFNKTEWMVIGKKFVVIQHGVDLDIFKPIKKEKSKTFKFLSNKGLRNLEDRGGVQYLIKAYIEEFSEEDVELIIKINPAYGVPNIEQMFPELKTCKAKIRFIVDNYTPKQLNELYNECDVYVSPTRAEAFNLPVLESLACGKPVIVTNFGGQTDYIEHDKTGWLVDYDLVDVEHELEYEGIKWATPKIEDLKSAMRVAYNKQLGIDNEDCINTAKKYTWSKTAKYINELIN